MIAQKAKEARIYKPGPNGQLPDLEPEDEELTVEARILRACKTIRVIDTRDGKFWNQFTGAAISWPETIREYKEAYGYEEAKRPRFRPTPRDVSDCLTALEWLNGLSKREFKYIWWRSFDLSFRQIGYKIGRSDERARQLYKDAIKAAHMEALRGVYEV